MRMLGRITFGLLLILALAVVVGFVTERVIRAQAAEHYPME